MLIILFRNSSGDKLSWSRGCGCSYVILANRTRVRGKRSTNEVSGLLKTSLRKREPLDRRPDEVMDIVDGYIDVAPENMLSLPSIEGEIVENVVPLAAREEIDGRCLWCRL